MQNSMLQWLSAKLLERPLQPRELLTARKLVYIFLVLVLFTASFFWRRNAVDARAVDLAIRQDSQGEVELSGELIRLSLTGSRGLATCFLWSQAIEKQKKNQWNEMEFFVRSLTKLQPHFIIPWLFQSWNLSYNVSVESDRVNDKYFFITRGIDLLAEGERQNIHNPDMRFSIGFYMQHKIMVSDQTNVLRTLFQLSMVPPSERDPDRFLKRSEDGKEAIDWVEFEKFVTRNPQLARRLHSGQMRDSKHEYQNQFTCRDAEEVIRFLRDNWRVPGIYVLPEKRPGVKVEPNDVLMPPESRYPPLPPPRANAFKPAGDVFTELTNESTLDDRIDGYGVARAWYGYSQEPLPGPDYLPGSNKPITDRVHQRKPRNMTILLFRNYPSLAEGAAAERLEQEGWFRPDRDEEQKAEAQKRTAEEYWEFPEDSWFRPRGNKFADGKTTARLVLQNDQHADKVWDLAHRMWIHHGQMNHLLFDDPKQEAEAYQDALKYLRPEGVDVGSQLPPPKEGVENLAGERKKQYEAAKYLFEYKFYRELSNFPHHHNRSKIEADRTTVACRKLFHEAESSYFRGDLVKARETYERPEALAAWRDEVLLGCVHDDKGRLVPRPGAVPAEHRLFREDRFIEEYTYETQLRYLMFYNEQFGTQIKKGVARTWEFTAIPASIPPAGSGIGIAFRCLAARLIETEWTPPPIGTAYADLKGPFDIHAFDPDEKDQPALAAALFGTAGSPFGASPLLATFTVGGWSKPLISPFSISVVRERKGLNAKKPQEGAKK
jgi:hypothetical protein